MRKLVCILIAFGLSGCSDARALQQTYCSQYTPSDTNFSDVEPLGWSFGKLNADGSSRLRFHTSSGAPLSTNFTPLYVFSASLNRNEIPKNSSVYLDVYHVRNISCVNKKSRSHAEVCLSNYCKLNFSISDGKIKNPALYILSAGRDKEILKSQPICLVSAAMFLAGEHGAWGRISVEDIAYSDDLQDWLISPTSEINKCINGHYSEKIHDK